ncbi:hypothetical protein PMAYCL1PPCAC_20374, partial [Pristionchus mayeri]
SAVASGGGPKTPNSDPKPAAPAAPLPSAANPLVPRDREMTPAEQATAIDQGLERSAKDDESVDDHKTDWGKTVP